MRKSIAIATLGLVLSFSSLSFASDYMSLYTKQEAKSEVRNEAIGGSVEGDFMSFYTSPKSSSKETPLVSDQETDDLYISAFGVRIAL